MDTEAKLKNIDQEISRELSSVGEKISKEKALIMEHEHQLQTLEKEKRDIETNTARKKKSFVESMSRLLFYKKREEQEFERAENLFKSNQMHLASAQQALRVFTQEVTVLENKIRSLSAMMR